MRKHLIILLSLTLKKQVIMYRELQGYIHLAGGTTAKLDTIQVGADMLTIITSLLVMEPTQQIGE